MRQVIIGRKHIDRLLKEVKTRVVRKQSDAARLRALLGRAQLSQREAARQLGIAERTMRYYISGGQPVPRAIMLALESLTGDPTFFRRLEARIRAQAGCRCEEFQIATYVSAEKGTQWVFAGLQTGTCKACADGTTGELAIEMLNMSAIPLIPERRPARHK